MAKSDALNEYLEGFRIWLQDACFTLGTEGSKEIWTGSVFVDWPDTQTGRTNSATHNVSIFLPPGFPYRAPVVWSTDQPPLEPSWHLAPEPAHSLCLWTPDIGWKPHFTAQRLLSRIEDWFFCYHTDSWPANSEVPDLHRYLETLGLVIIGDEWSPENDRTSGRFTLWRHHSSNTFSAIACCNRDDNPSHDARTPEARLAQALMFSEESYRAHCGVWYRLTSPFVPQDSLGGLLVSIDQHIDEAEGYAAQACLHRLGRKPRCSGWSLALGYMDNQGQERWLFLWIQLPQSAKKRTAVRWSDPAELSRIKVKSFQTAPSGRADLLRRCIYMSKHLCEHRVTVFGVGALGGSVALLLAKAGIGEIRIVDSDKLTPGNAMRHICGLNWAGFQKTTAVNRAINVHNPDCCVVEYSATWDSEELRSYIKDCAVVIDTTANHNFSLLLNEVSIDCHRPVVFATAYRRAAIGRIVIRRSNADPCLACYVDSANWPDGQYPTIPADPDEAFLEDGCGSVTEEAAALDVEAIANLAARVVVRLLQGQLGYENLAILVNQPLAEESGILACEGLHWLQNTPLAKCAICQK